jgi:hypothetical protein
MKQFISIGLIIFSFFLTQTTNAETIPNNFECTATVTSTTTVREVCSNGIEIVTTFSATITQTAENCTLATVTARIIGEIQTHNSAVGYATISHCP